MIKKTYALLPRFLPRLIFSVLALSYIVATTDEELQRYCILAFEVILITIQLRAWFFPGKIVLGEHSITIPRTYFGVCRTVRYDKLVYSLEGILGNARIDLKFLDGTFVIYILQTTIDDWDDFYNELCTRISEEEAPEVNFRRVGKILLIGALIIGVIIAAGNIEP